MKHKIILVFNFTKCLGGYTCVTKMRTEFSREYSVNKLLRRVDSFVGQYDRINSILSTVCNQSLCAKLSARLAHFSVNIVRVVLPPKHLQSINVPLLILQKGENFGE